MYLLDGCGDVRGAVKSQDSVWAKTQTHETVQLCTENIKFRDCVEVHDDKDSQEPHSAPEFGPLLMEG